MYQTPHLKTKIHFMAVSSEGNTLWVIVTQTNTQSVGVCTDSESFHHGKTKENSPAYMHILCLLIHTGTAYMWKIIIIILKIDRFKGFITKCMCESVREWWRNWDRCVLPLHTLYRWILLNYSVSLEEPKLNWLVWNELSIESLWSLVLLSQSSRVL